MHHECMARKKFFSDDLCSAIESAVQNNCGDCGEDDEHDALRANISTLTSIALSVGLTFCWAKRVTWQGREFVAWSALRASLRLVIAHTLTGLWSRAIRCLGPFSSLPSRHSLVVEALNKAVDAASISAVVSPELLDLLEAGAGDALKEFLEYSTSAMPAHLHSDFNQCATKVWEKVGELPGNQVTSVLDVMQLIAPEVFLLIPPDWLRLAQ